MRYKPEFNCFIRGVLEKLGRLPDIPIYIRHGDMRRVLEPYEYNGTIISYTSNRMWTLVPETSGGLPDVGSWGYSYRKTSFPVSLGHIGLSVKGSYIEIFMGTELVNPEYELPMYLGGIKDV